MPDFGGLEQSETEDLIDNKINEKLKANIAINRKLLNIFSNKITLFLLSIIPIMISFFIFKFQFGKNIDFIAPCYELLGFIVFAISEYNQPKGGFYYPKDWDQCNKNKDIFLRRFGYSFVLVGFCGWIISSLL